MTLRFWPEETEDGSFTEMTAGRADWRWLGNQKHCFQPSKPEMPMECLRAAAS